MSSTPRATPITLDNMVIDLTTTDKCKYTIIEVADLLTLKDDGIEDMRYMSCAYPEIDGCKQIFILRLTNDVNIRVDGVDCEEIEKISTGYAIDIRGNTLSLVIHYHGGRVVVDIPTNGNISVLRGNPAYHKINITYNIR